MGFTTALWPQWQHGHPPPPPRNAVVWLLPPRRDPRALGIGHKALRQVGQEEGPLKLPKCSPPHSVPSPRTCFLSREFFNYCYLCRRLFFAIKGTVRWHNCSLQPFWGVLFAFSLVQCTNSNRSFLLRAPRDAGLLHAPGPCPQQRRQRRGQHSRGQLGRLMARSTQ